jgi:hypothetical protein
MKREERNSKTPNRPPSPSFRPVRKVSYPASVCPSVLSAGLCALPLPFPLLLR